MSKAVKAKDQWSTIKDSELPEAAKEKLRQSLIEAGFDPAKVDTMKIRIPTIVDNGDDHADLEEGERNYLAQAEDVIMCACANGVQVADGDGIQVFSGNPDAEKIEDFSTETPQELRVLIKHIETNHLTETRPWSHVYDVYKMLLAIGQEQ